MEKTYSIIIHGGATEMDDGTGWRVAIEKCLKLGEKMSLDNCTAREIVVALVTFLEDFETFNAGKGSALNQNKEHELEATIVENNKYGSVSRVTQVKNPIQLANCIMNEYGMKHISGEQTTELAIKYQLPIVDNNYYTTEYRKEEWKKKHMDPENFNGSTGTVGVVVRDSSGNICAGTSTGGLCYKEPGRIGDTCNICASTYANNEIGGLSTTGKGEIFVQYAVAANIVALHKYGNISFRKAAKTIIKSLPKAAGAVIGIDNVGKPFMFKRKRFVVAGYLYHGEIRIY